MSADVRVTRLPGPFGFGMSVDLEEWYHTCLEPDFVETERRPTLPRELDALIPALLALFAEQRRRVTFFVLGEAAAQVPQRIRDIAADGHEIACHGYHHLRVGSMPSEQFRADVSRCKGFLEDLVGVEVRGYRAPEWSLRRASNPRLRVLAELGFAYDSSLTTCWGSGERDNPAFPSRLDWDDFFAAGPGVVGGASLSLVELPPLTFAGRWQLPAGGWPGRLAGVDRIVRAAREHHAAGGMPVLVVHPWEIAERPLPGELMGLARWIHELGRPGYRQRFAELLAAVPFVPLGEALAPELADERPTLPEQAVLV